MAEFGQLDIYGNLNIKDNLFVRNNIIQDDILYPICNVSALTSVSSSVYIYIKKKDNVLTTSERKVNFNTVATPYYKLMPARPAIHWWISTSNYGAPIALALPRGVTVNFRLLNGVMLDPDINTTITNSATVKTALTDNTHLFAFRLENNGGATTYYLMYSIQGIVYSTSFTSG